MQAECPLAFGGGGLQILPLPFPEPSVVMA